jgi:hypothetical protein
MKKTHNTEEQIASCAAATGDRNNGWGSDPEDRHLHPDVLSVEQAVRPDRRERNLTFEANRRGESEAQAVSG